MNSLEIKEAFFDYFTKKGHELVASASLVPIKDPSLLFTNAGMVPFKDVFLGLEKRPYKRAVSAQRCIRAGGKHNDLEQVGYTARHHTFFEMLGNFSFGDYFKREAINYAWEFLTQVLKLPKEKLWITVYQEDDEAANIWLNELGVSSERFSRCGEQDNFWSMGDTGPCGPCTEIFYDHGPEIPGGPPGSPEADKDRYVEIWNLVFMQYNRDSQGILHPLPRPSVDTGMGLERIAAVVQGVHSNYDIDVFKYLLEAISKCATPAIDLKHPSLKVIADHLRAAAFLISDGVFPGNEERSYVLRRIVRRALRHGHQLNLPSPFFYNLVTPLIQVMGDTHPHLVAAKEQIEKILLLEENQFAKTLEQGLALLKEEIAHLKGKELSGEIAFKLYDTFGFPLDLTQDLAAEQGIAVDLAGFNTRMQAQRELSQAASLFSSSNEAPPMLEHQSQFHGYETKAMQTKLTGIFVDGQEETQLQAGTKALLVLNASPFYAESGGQVGDQGFIHDTRGSIFKVEDTQKLNQAIVHYGRLESGYLVLGQEVQAEVDCLKRQATALNHTATHLLHAALKHVLGSHVEQKGSLVEAERARFDFSHNSALSPSEIEKIEILVNEKIRENIEVKTVLMNLEEAKKSGAMALFGEKYSDEVRVLQISDFSQELCGGTHARFTGELGLFKIVAEYGIASGIRRIEMLTGAYALDYLNQQLATLNTAAETLKTEPKNLLEKLNQVLQSLKLQQKELNKAKEALATKSGKDWLSEVQRLGKMNVLIKELKDTDSQGLRTALDSLKANLENAVILLYSLDETKINVVAGLSKNLIGKVPSAPELVQDLCGRGGGRPDMAQGGGSLPDDLNQKISELKERLKASSSLVSSD